VASEEAMFATQVLDVKAERRNSGLNPPFSPEDIDTVLAELDRLLESHYFKASRRCRSFLNLIVRETLMGNIEPLKERFLGVTLFHRDIGYDTNADPVVRVTAGEVRKRLSQCYEGSKASTIRIIIPVGSYVPRFEVLKESIAITDTREHERLLRALSSTREWLKPIKRRGALRRTLPQTAEVALIAILLSFAFKKQVIAKSNQMIAPQTAFATFWRPFVNSQADTLAVFAEVPYRSGHAGSGTTLNQSGAISGEIASPVVSGVGEVMGMHALDEDFKALRLKLQPKRESFFTFDVAAGENLIFLGSPLTNQPLQEFPTTDFVFRAINSDSGKSTLGIVNDHPMPGERTQFLSTPETLPLESDYAIIALIPSMGSSKHILLLAGITTFGTEAAAEFVSREESLRGLLPRLRISKDGNIQPFEVLIKVTIKDEVPIREQIVAVHH
jgi:hypothetical protein